MPKPTRMHHWLHERLDDARLHLSRPDALILLAILGLVTGLVAGAVIILFRLAVEGIQMGFLPKGSPENYEDLPIWARFFLPVIGGLAIGLLFKWAAGGIYVLGVARVMERMAYHQGHLTKRGFFLQFLGAAIAIISGHSVGREGPHIYLGAASGSLLGQRLSLPNNSIRTMVACGTAAGIAASFNTPLAGVIFSLEVVMMEYTLASFIPVILAAVSATTLTIAVFGSDPAFRVPTLAMESLTEIPLVLLLGIAVGTVSALFIHLIQWLAAKSHAHPFWWRTTLAGFMVGICAVAVPEIMGIGYDTVNGLLLGELGTGLLLLLLIFKLLATSASIGLGIPGGMIGPALFMGATLGSLVGLIGGQVVPSLAGQVGFYALLGMGAMMGASLQAPLAALTAMIELTHNPEIVMPGMLAVVIAGLTTSVLFRKESLFIAMLKASGMDYAATPLLQALRRIGVASVMNDRFQRTSANINRDEAEKLLAKEPEWLLIDRDGQPEYLMPAADLARFLTESENPQFNLLDIPARRLQAAPIHLQATLQEALDKLESSGAEAIFVERVIAPGIKRYYGILNREQIESAYRY